MSNRCCMLKTQAKLLYTNRVRCDGNSTKMHAYKRGDHLTIFTHTHTRTYIPKCYEVEKDETINMQ